MRLSSLLCLAFALAVSSACSGSGPEADPHAGMNHAAPADAVHEGVTGPHGDHEPKHGGLVLMNDDLHYEIVFSPEGRHEVWFSDAMRNELPASLASHVTLTVLRPGEPPEVLALGIDGAGEAWLARGRAVEGDEVTVKVSYAVMGDSHEIEVPFVPAK
jgi:hypothetical protein